MLGELLCKMGVHDWAGADRWFPSFHASIVTRYESRMQCSRCGKVDEVVFTYDEVDGQPLDIIQNGIVTKYADM